MNIYVNIFILHSFLCVIFYMSLPINIGVFIKATTKMTVAKCRQDDLVQVCLLSYLSKELLIFS